MAGRPEVGLYDDPFTGLDPVACARIARLVAAAHDEVGGVTLVAASDPTPLLDVCRRFVLLEEGRVAFDGPADAFASARAPAVRRYLGRETA
jgi:ABC-type transporter Mla maintaining outer membrane lipid asymmetry ATPase subunit MlaF